MTWWLPGALCGWLSSRLTEGYYLNVFGKVELELGNCGQSLILKALHRNTTYDIGTALQVFIRPYGSYV